jgi:hypothetical protein
MKPLVYENREAFIRPDPEDSTCLVLAVGGVEIDRSHMPGAGNRLAKAAWAHGCLAVHHSYDLALDEPHRYFAAVKP